MTPRPLAARRVNWSRVLVYGLFPGLALVLAMAAGFLKWQDASSRSADIARNESIQAAKASAVALLSFRSNTVEKDVAAARDRLTGQFRDTFTQVSREVLIPNAQEHQVSAVARVAAAASESVAQNHAVVLVFVDQTVKAAGSPAANTVSGVRVTLDRADGSWLVSGWDPIE
jgi:Mce-associated membrane protein